MVYAAKSGIAPMIICSAILVSCSGCITASLVTLGTVLGAVGTAASTGLDAYNLGKLDTAFMTNADQCHRAVVLAAGDLGLHILIDERKSKPTTIIEMTLKDDLKSQVGIHIEYRTPSMCLCRVDVGIFGSEVTAKLMMERIRFHLHLPPTTSIADGSIQSGQRTQ